MYVLGLVGIRMSDRTFTSVTIIVFGLFMAVLGFGVIGNPRFYLARFGYQVDLTGYSVAVGLAVIAMGLSLAIFEIVRLARAKSRHDD